MSTRPDFARSQGLDKHGNGSASQPLLQWIAGARRELGSVCANLERAASHVQATQAGVGLMKQCRSLTMLRAAEAVREADQRAEQIQGLALSNECVQDSTSEGTSLGGR